MDAKLTKTEDYAGRPAYQVTLDGKNIGTVRKTRSRTPVYAKGTRYAAGHTERTTWVAQDPRDVPVGRLGTGRTDHDRRGDAVQRLVNSALARQ